MLLPTPPPRPAKPFNVLAAYYGGGADSVGVSWATPPDNDGVVAEGYRVERRECRSYQGGEYSTTTNNGEGLVVTVTTNPACAHPSGRHPLRRRGGIRP